jgi:hypothetical protein
MNLFLKVAVVIVLVALLVSALLGVLASLFSRFLPDSYPRLADPDDGEPDYDEHDVLVGGRERNRIAHS